VFLVSSRDTAKLLEFVEEPFDAIPLFVFNYIIRNGLSAVGACRDYWLDTIEG